MQGNSEVETSHICQALDTCIWYMRCLPQLVQRLPYSYKFVFVGWKHQQLKRMYPSIATCAPLVDLNVRGHPAKFASADTPIPSSLISSPIQHICLWCRVNHMYHISLNRPSLHSSVHACWYDASACVALSKSGLAIKIVAASRFNCRGTTGVPSF